MNSADPTEAFPAIRDLAVIGDGRTAAVLSRSGRVEWLCLPDLDSPSMFASLLDRAKGGSFLLRPALPFEATWRYVPQTNVLETTYRTSRGAVRVTDAMTFAGPGLAPARELVRRVEGLTGRVPMRWCMEPRSEYGTRPMWLRSDGHIVTGRTPGGALALSTWGAGRPRCREHAAHGHFAVTPARPAWFSLVSAHGEPLVMPALAEVKRRLESTIDFWRTWAAALNYTGRWRQAVVRSALVLKLLIHAPSGAIAAAATTSLPETPSGDGTWDYRFCWPRDAAFTVDALLSLRCPAEAESFFSWLMHATQLTHPRLRVLYRLDGSVARSERPIRLAGYRGAVAWTGNAADSQLQLDVYGEVVAAAARMARGGMDLDRDTARRIAGLADEVCRRWREPDHGIWELRGRKLHYTHSKMMCWVALTTATRLAEMSVIPAGHVSRWRRSADDVARFVEAHCWCEHKRAYTLAAGDERLDAGLLLALVAGYDTATERWSSTVSAIRAELAQGVLVWRLPHDPGAGAREGAFMACSFWLAAAYTRLGRIDDAERTMDGAVVLANDVGLFSEEIDPRRREFLGNIPQGLVHLALISAATAIAEARR